MRYRTQLVVFFTARTSFQSQRITAVEFEQGSPVPPPPDDGRVYAGYYLEGEGLLVDGKPALRSQDYRFGRDQVVQLQDVGYEIHA